MPSVWGCITHSLATQRGQSAVVVEARLTSVVQHHRGFCRYRMSSVVSQPACTCSVQAKEGEVDETVAAVAMQLVHVDDPDPVVGVVVLALMSINESIAVLGPKEHA